MLRSDRLRLHCLASALCLSGALLLARPTLAESAPAELTPAQAQYRRAHEAMGNKDWDEARRLLLDLWGKSRTYDVAASLGQVEYQLQNYASGARYLNFAVSNLPPMEKAETVERFSTALGELKKRVGAVKLTVEPANANVLVDGAELDPSERAQVFLNPGAHTFEARANGGNSTAKTLDVVAGGSYALSLQVTAVTNGAPASDPLTPSPSPAPDAGATAANDESRSVIPIYAGAGLTVVGGTLAIIFGISADNAREDVDRYREETGPNGCSDGTAKPTTCESLEAAYDRQRRDATVSNVALGVTIGAAAGTLAYYFFWPKKTAASTGLHLRPSVAVDTTQGSLGLEGRF